MKPFLGPDFLLDTPTAVELYHEVAKHQPIIDYHCHLSPQQIADNHQFADLTEAWLSGDHYKWRALRTNGVPERAITGDASPWEKFEAWARTVPYTLRNPLYHWTHLELQFPFRIQKLLDPSSARAIYDAANEALANPEFTTQGLLKQFNVVVVCSTDDPVDSLEPHRRHATNPAAFTKLLPTWRPDRALAVHDLEAWNGWVDLLSSAADANIRSYSSFLEALGQRHSFFHESGCRASDHGLERLYTREYTEREIAGIFDKARAARALTLDEVEKFRSAVLYDLALMDQARGWVQQFHLGALRNNNTRALRTRGPDTGYDAIGDFSQAADLARFLDRLDSSDQLAKTIVYNLNPADNEVFATILGSFQDGSVPGKMQFGSAWWFLDQLDGMRKQLDTLSNMGLLSRFVGMLTDSRSFLSYSRHEYFRRLLCSMLGEDVERGLIPNDAALLRTLVRDVCFENARSYFEFAVAPLNPPGLAGAAPVQRSSSP